MTDRIAGPRILLLTLTALYLQSTASVSAKTQPPNIVIIFADDQGYADVGKYGAEDFTTPHMDRMADQGIRFTDFYVACPACSGSRASLLTGCYFRRLGLPDVLGPNSKIALAPDEMTIADLVKQRGYATAIYGKWHLGDHDKFLPKNQGFDHYFGLPYSNDMWPKHPTLGDKFPDLPLIEQTKVIELNPDQTHLTTWYTQRAVRFIEKNKDRPFFLYVPHSMPHVPLYVSNKFKDKTLRGLYGDVISEIDWSVGQILATLKKHRLDKRTLVIYTSDNGPWLSYGSHGGSAKPLREGKGTTFEGGVRVPAICHWPGKIPPGILCREPVMTIDILPTIASIIDAPLPNRQIDGKNIWPLMTGQPAAKSPHEALFFYRQRQLQAMRSGKWKLHFPHQYRTLAGRPGGNDGQPVGYEMAKIELSLFDLENDIGETTNVADQHPDVVKRLQNLADKIRDDIGDKLTDRKGANVRKPGILESPKKPQTAPAAK